MFFDNMLVFSRTIAPVLIGLVLVARELVPVAHHPRIQNFDLPVEYRDLPGPRGDDVNHNRARRY